MAVERWGSLRCCRKRVRRRAVEGSRILDTRFLIRLPFIGFVWNFDENE